MYECPNCGGNLKFDIESQDLHCKACNTHMDPYSFSKEKDAEESQEYDVTIFTCPQCAGEIYSTDETAAAFCTFCGASTILDSRLTKEKRPKYILPFQKTKEDCKQAYFKTISRAWFAPRELKDPKYVDGFRGIYMPYWLYDMNIKGRTAFPGTKSYRRGDYDITKHYNIEGDIDCEYNGISYDASAAFSDSISQRLAPFDTKKMKPFTPAFLSGFYADVADVDEEIYRKSATDFVKERLSSYLREDKTMRSYHAFNDVDKLKRYMNIAGQQEEAAMFPVWFMSYRKGNRVAYATVNGQTGKVVADLPVDPVKYVIGSAILTFFLFLLLNTFVFLRPISLLLLICLISAFTIWLYGRELRQIRWKDEALDDAGMQYKGSLKEKQFSQTKGNSSTEKIKNAIKKNKQIYLVVGIIILFRVGLDILNTSLNGLLYMLDNPVLLRLFYLVFLMAAIGILLYYRKDYQYVMEEEKKIPLIAGSLVSICISIGILIIKPAHDIYYYGAVIAALTAELVAVFDLIRHYNILVTRKLPQFDRKGGDDSAR